jgi:hypothetical protein
MKALVYRGRGNKTVEDRPKPELHGPGDAIVKIAKTTICGTDLHILKGDVATVAPGRVPWTRGNRHRRIRRLRRGCLSLRRPSLDLLHLLLCKV